jgi:hypothetical protein
MRDQFWPNTTLLLQGNGTNGAQNNTFLDSSANNFTITRNGNTTQGSFTPYEANGYWSNYFSGSSDYIRFPNNAAFQFGSGDMTVEAWVFTTGQQVLYGGSISSYGTASSFNGWNLAITGSNETPVDRVIFAYNYSNAVYSTATIPRNQWVHIAATKSGTTLRLFINGVLDTSSTFNYSVSTGANDYAYVGTQGYDPGSSNRTFTGYISNVRVLKGTAQYTSAFTPSTTPLTAIANTSLLTAQSNRFLDNSANAFAVTVGGAPSVQAFQPFPGATTWSGSVLGGSGYFDGSGDSLSLSQATAMSLGTGDFTVEAWVYPTANPSSFWSIIDARGSASNIPWAAGMRLVSGALKATFFNGADIQGTITVPLNAWTHVAFARQGSTLRGFVNGVLDINTTMTTNLNVTGTQYIGAIVDPTYDTGYIADCRVVKGTAAYTAAFTPPTAPLTAITNTQLLLNFTNAGIFDSAMMNNLETVGNAQVSTSVVKYGTGSMYFDGSGDWLAGPPTPQTDLGSGDFTIEAWLYRTASGAASDSGMVSRGAPSTLNGFVFAYTSANVLTFNFNYSGAIVTGVTVIPANTWTHVAVSRNGSTFRLFVNGVVDATATSTNSQTTNASDVFYVGRAGYDSGRIVTGYLDDVRLTKGAARYIGNFTPPVARMPQQ